MNKVFFILNTNDYSGAEAVNFSIIKELRNKYDFYWVCKKGNINKFLEHENIKYINIDSLSKKEIRRVVKEYNPDILHCTDYRASCICAMAKTGKPVIAHLHHNAPWIKTIHPFSFLLLYCNKKFDKILTVSASIEKEYIFSKYLKSEIMNIGNPVSVNKVLNNVSNEDKLKKYDICCTARIDIPKNPLRFIKLISEVKNEIPNIKVIWIGQGELLDDCKKLRSELNLEENIEFVGFQENPYEYMSKSKLFMMTSDWEGYGLVAFEALALGLPTIVSDVGGLVDIVDDSCGRLCKTDKDFIDEVISLLKDSKKLSDKSKNAVNKSLKLDNMKEYMNTIDKIYSDILEK